MRKKQLTFYGKFEKVETSTDYSRMVHLTNSIVIMQFKGTW